MYISTRGIRGFAAKDFIWGLCKKSFAACGGKIFFGWKHHFSDFALRNQKNDVSIQI